MVVLVAAGVSGVGCGELPWPRNGVTDGVGVIALLPLRCDDAIDAIDDVSEYAEEDRGEKK